MFYVEEWNPHDNGFNLLKLSQTVTKKSLE